VRVANGDNENLADEVTQRLREQVDALTDAEKAVVRARLTEIEKPPAPDYANMDDGEFQRLKSSLIK
jgi:hypothetical protein